MEAITLPVTPRPASRGWAAAALLLLVLGGCRNETPAPPADGANVPEAVPPEPADAADHASAAPLADVVETDPRYVVGISYPPGAATDPGLAKALRDYAEAARGDLMQAVAGLQDPPTAPYELSLGFRELVRSPALVAVAADGSLYTGGAHGQPLVARFVWLPPQQAMLTSQALLASPAGWRPVSDYIGEQLGAAAHVRAEDEALAPADRERLLAVALKMIDEGTEPQPANFAQFEPVMDADGRIAALRFVFPPYQVGPYADGVQTVDVPAAVLRPHLAADVAGLFAD